MFAKKGQLSVETMIIYGLVILVAISVIGLLIYFDVLDLGAYLPDKCDIGGTGDLKCEETQLSGTTLELGVRNIGQKPISFLSIMIDDTEDIHFTNTPSSGNVLSDTLAPGEIVAVSITLTGSDPGRVLQGALTTDYMYLDGAVMQKASGSLRLKAS